MKPPSKSDLIKASLIQVVINAVINGIINYFMVRHQDVHLITADSITEGGSDTVIGQAVFTAVLLAIIFTMMGFKSYRQQLPDVSWRDVGLLAVKNGIYAFGLVVIAGVLWQRMFPNIMVGTLGAAGIAGVIAGFTAGITNYSTLTTLFERVR